MKKILIADDNKHIVKILSEGLGRALADTEYELETFNEGRGALDRIDEGGIDLAVLDVFMPNLDGHKLIARLRENPEHAALRILVVTAGGLEETARAIEGGADLALTKPLRLHDVASAVRQLLRLP